MVHEADGDVGGLEIEGIDHRPQRGVCREARRRLDVLVMGTRAITVEGVELAQHELLTLARDPLQNDHLDAATVGESLHAAARNKAQDVVGGAAQFGAVQNGQHIGDSQ